MRFMLNWLFTSIAIAIATFLVPGIQPFGFAEAWVCFAFVGDCEDLLNIGLLRPIFSPTDFIQIKGRGTRKHDFIFKERNGGQEIVHKYPKESFKLLTGKKCMPCK